MSRRGNTSNQDETHSHAESGSTAEAPSSLNEASNGSDEAKDSAAISEDGDFDDNSEDENGDFDDNSEDEDGDFDDDSEDEDGDLDDDDFEGRTDLKSTIAYSRLLYYSHSLGGRLRIASATGLILLVLTMMLFRGLEERHRAPFGPLINWYTDGLGLARSWGMFAHPGTELPIFAYGDTQSGAIVQLSPPPTESLWVRIRDQRMRKIRAHLRDERTRENWGANFTSYLCRTESTPGRPLKSVRVVEINRMNEGEGKTLLTNECAKK